MFSKDKVVVIVKSVFVLLCMGLWSAAASLLFTINHNLQLDRDEAVANAAYQSQQSHQCVEQRDTVTTYLQYSLMALDNMSGTLNRLEEEKFKVKRLKRK